MGKLTLIILAGGEKGPLYEPTGFETKALIPIHGKPMIDWVIEAFHSQPEIGSIVVVGPEELEACASMRFVRKRISPGVNLLSNVLAAVHYVKSSIYEYRDQHEGYLFSFCDAVFLTPDIVRHTLTTIQERKADIHLHYVEKSSFEKEGLPAERTYIPVEDKHYTGSTLYYIKKFSLVKSMVDLFGKLRKNRKDPHGLLEALDCDGKSLTEIEQTLSARLTADVAISVSPHARLGMDVDKPSDLALAKELLTPPWPKTNRRAVIIFNPNAGSGIQLSPVLLQMLGIKSRKKAFNEDRMVLMKKAADYLQELGLDCELAPTEYAGHAGELARVYAEKGVDTVIAGGGDGTVNEVINGLVGTGSRLGVIPMGTANILALELNLPYEIQAACQVIATGNTLRIDLGNANGRYFSCMAGVGFDAHVIQKADSKLKKVWGILAYPLVCLWEFLFYRFRKIKVFIDDQPLPRSGYWITISNSKYYAGKLPFAPQADMTDGYLDVSIFKHRDIFHLILYIMGIWRNEVDKIMSIEQFQCKQVVIKKGKNGVHVDAEYLQKTPVTITVEEQVLEVFQ